MTSTIASLLDGSKRRHLLLDSNLLLLWITAKYDPGLLSTFKRVQMFDQQDAVLLAWIIDQFKSVVTTSHVVTEASNLGNSLSSRSRIGWFTLLAEFSSHVREETRPLSSLASLDAFVHFGITDCAIAALAGSYQVLTTDYRLSNYARDEQIHVLNFNDLRHMV